MPSLPLRLVVAAAMLLSAGGPLTAQAARGPAGRAGVASRSIPRVPLTAGRSTVIATDFDITRIAITNPAIADAVVVQPREILIDGKSPGTVSLIVWGAGRRDAVRRGRRTGRDDAASSTCSMLFPGEDIRRRASTTRRRSCRAACRATR